MKKKLLILFFISAGLFAMAQTRMALYEEFTSETNSSCASINPVLNALLSANASKVIAIKWQVPLPSAPSPTWSLYKTDMADNDARYRSTANGGYGYPESSGTPTANYINSAPNGRMNGEQLNVYGITASSYNHPANLNTTAINNAQALATPFLINMNTAWDATYSNAVVSVTVQSSSAFTSVASLSFRLVLVEREIHFENQSGTNGEKDFYDPVRKAYPNIQTGTVLSSVWAPGQTQVFNITCAIPSYIVDKSQMAFVGFLQDDGDKKIWQAARTPQPVIPNDVKVISVNTSSVICSPFVNPSVIVKNNGVNTITSLTIAPYIDGVAQPTFTSNLNIAGSATAVVSLNSYSVTNGSHTFSINITGVSGGDVNTVNNKGSVPFVNAQNYFNAPVSETFSTSIFPPVNWFKTNADNGVGTWVYNSSAGFNGAGSAKYDFYNNGSLGDVDELYIKPLNLLGVTNPSLSFDVSYATYSNTENDKLEVMVSTNCGSSWTSIYMKAGNTLTTSIATISIYLPNSASQWRHEIVALPTGAANNQNVLVKFVATSDYGNNLYLDNVNINYLSFSTTSNGNACIGIPVSFSNNSSVVNTYTWTANPAATIVAPSAANTSITFNNTGTYTVALAASNGTTTFNSIQTYTVTTPPTVSISASTTTLCSGSNVNLVAGGSASSFVWNPGNLTGSFINPTPYTTTTYTLMGSDANGSCVITKTVGLNVTATPTLLVSNNITTCYGLATTLNASGASTYLWDNLATSAAIVVTPTASAIYTVVGNNGSCSDTKTISVTVGTLVSIFASTTSNSICSSSSVVLSAFGANTYTWLPDNITGSSVFVTPISNTTYTVIGDAGSCIGDTVITISVVTTPTVSVNSSALIMCIGQMATLTANGATNYYWNLNSSSSSIIVIPNISTTYTVIGYNANCSSQATITQSVSLCTALEAQALVNNLMVYPNPATNNLYISYSGGTFNYKIMDNIGRLILEKSGNRDVVEINLTCITKGIYYLEVISETEISRKKIIKD